MRNDPRFRILDVDWRDSKGACWARAEIMHLWRDEQYYLQIDSHHRFAQDWDVKLKHYAALTNTPKSVLTAYCPMYVPGSKIVSSYAPTQMDFDYFTQDGIPMFKASDIPKARLTGRPLRARFVSGHFLFTQGSFTQEVPYDPDLYFHGEEIMLAVRAYTWGYDLFHPPEALLWHEYSREYRRKHWDDHVDSASVELSWDQRDGSSRKKVCRFLQEPYCGPFGCGPFRTAAQYSQYAGIDLKHQKVEQHTLEGQEPPNRTSPAKWLEPRKWTVGVSVKRSSLTPDAFTNPDFWYLGFHDSSGKEIYRQDVSGKELAAATAANIDPIVIKREFVSGRTPISWTIWPMSRKKGWLAKIQGPIQ